VVGTSSHKSLENIYLILLVVLFALAVSDLIVGVSNDAVNFLNSAIGSKVASRKTIMIVASVGIFIGATFSSGIMEVARSGIFFPDRFLFEDVMIIFLSVMLTDILLLDLFNTFGLPTSTTVSIVFELLGAAFAIGILKIINSDQGLSNLGSYINSDSALGIVSSIFLSVAIAFTVGMIVQYFSRLIFTFQYKKNQRTVGVIWSALAITTIFYFLVIKGVKGASFISAENIEWFQSNALIISLTIFVISSLAFLITTRVTNFDILKVVVLCGTFSLAMAFAGNDLVNFIGVPIAGLESYKEWIASGIAPNELYMGSLNGAIQTETYLLLIAGGIMVLTLWFSKKARSVTDTEVNLGSQGDVAEKFKPNRVGRLLVKGAIRLGSSITSSIPNKLINTIDKSFKKQDLDGDEKPAFDLVRASVNLTVASALIAAATSLKLPLSTTYVSFMVAMGTSLSDKAWGRDSAVYRVSGVINVILGWFGTALIAFTVSAIFATLIYTIGLWVIGLIVVGAVAAIIKSFSFHKNQKIRQEFANRLKSYDILNESTAIEELKERLKENIAALSEVYSESIKGLTDENLDELTSADERLGKLLQSEKNFKNNLIRYIEKLDETKGNSTSELYISVYGLEQDYTQSISLIVDNCLTHVNNLHKTLNEHQSKGLNKASSDLVEYLNAVQLSLSKNSSEDSDIAKKRILDHMESLIDMQVEDVKQTKYSFRNSSLFFNIIIETRDLVNAVSKVSALFAKK